MEKTFWICFPPNFSCLSISLFFGPPAVKGCWTNYGFWRCCFFHTWLCLGSRAPLESQVCLECQVLTDHRWVSSAARKCEGEKNWNAFVRPTSNPVGAVTVAERYSGVSQCACDKRNVWPNLAKHFAFDPLKPHDTHLDSPWFTPSATARINISFLDVDQK